MANQETLKSLTTKIGSGATPTGGQNTYGTSGVTLIRSQNVLDFSFSDKGLAHIDSSQAKSLDGVTVSEGDILLNITGDSIARACMAPATILPARVNQHVSIIRCKPGVDSRYVLYYLEYLKSYLLKICRVGGTRNALTKDVLEELVITMHDNPTAIAATLAAIEAKIQLNHKINFELESIARTIHDFWFVQYDYPDEDGKPYKTSGGKLIRMTKPSQDIPAGWSVQNIFSVADIGGGGTPSKSDESYWQGEIPFFTPSDADEDVYCVETEDYITSQGLASSSTKLFPKGTIFITARGSVGNVVVASRGIAMNQSCYAFIPKQGISSAFVYFSAKNMIRYLKAKSSGSVFNSIVTSDVEYTPLVIPPKPLVHKYNEIMDPLFEKILLTSLETQRLVKIRDWLLPMLMSGRVTIKQRDAQKVQPYEMTH